ncbi:MAG: hypothetical protein II956_10595 [Bacteroidales bacterium]|nr:hypothetical protein [Bacteroidales bacterium]
MDTKPLINLCDYLLATLSQEDLLYVIGVLEKNTQKRYTLKEYQQMVENGRLQAERGEVYSTDEVMRMCMEDELELEAV